MRESVGLSACYGANQSSDVSQFSCTVLVIQCFMQDDHLLGNLREVRLFKKFCLR